jgi:hypothetical protein
MVSQPSWLHLRTGKPHRGGQGGSNGLYRLQFEDMDSGLENKSDPPSCGIANWIPLRSFGGASLAQFHCESLTAMQEAGRMTDLSWQLLNGPSKRKP